MMTGEIPGDWGDQEQQGQGRYDLDGSHDTVSNSDIVEVLRGLLQISALYNFAPANLEGLPSTYAQDIYRELLDLIGRNVTGGFFLTRSKDFQLGETTLEQLTDLGHQEKVGLCFGCGKLWKVNTRASFGNTTLPAVRYRVGEGKPEPYSFCGDCKNQVDSAIGRGDQEWVQQHSTK